MSFDEVRVLAKQLPGVVDSTSYRTPALKVNGKLLGRLKEDGETLVLSGIPIEQRAMLIKAEPDLFFFTDHYRDYPMVLVRLSPAGPEDIAALLFARWREVASTTMLAAFQQACRSGERSLFARIAGPR
jgi:hypothetical protein